MILRQQCTSKEQNGEMQSIVFHNLETAAEIYIFFAWRVTIYSGGP